MKQLTRTELVIAWLLGIYFGVIAAAIVATSMAVAGITGAWEGMASMLFHPAGAVLAVLFVATAPIAIVGGLIAAMVGRKKRRLA